METWQQAESLIKRPATRRMDTRSVRPVDCNKIAVELPLFNIGLERNAGTGSVKLRGAMWIPEQVTVTWLSNANALNCRRIGVGGRGRGNATKRKRLSHISLKGSLVSERNAVTQI